MGFFCFLLVFFVLFLTASLMFQHNWTPPVLSVLYAGVFYFCICPCAAQLSMFHMERLSRNTLIIIIIINARHLAGEPLEY